MDNSFLCFVWCEIKALAQLATFDTDHEDKYRGSHQTRTFHLRMCLRRARPEPRHATERREA